MNTHTLQNAGC